MSGSITRAAADYLQCSLNGVPFAVMGSSGAHGRKQAEHDYPYRDGVWIEDLGKRAQQFSVRGFVTGALYLTRRNLLVDVAETAGTSLFVHPTLGALTGWVRDFSWSEPDGKTGVIDIEFVFTQKTNVLGAVITQALMAAVEVATTAYSAAASSDYTSTTTGSYDYGASVVASGVSVATTWAGGALTAVQSPAAYAGAASIVAGNNGRYANGNVQTIDSSATTSSVIEDLSEAQASVQSMLSTLADATGPAAIATSVLAITELVRTSLNDPDQQITALTALCVCDPTVMVSSAPIGSAIASVQTSTAMLCRQAALLSLALACANWQPASYDAAIALQTQVATLLDDEALIAADAGNTATYMAMRALRAQVVLDLSQRASALPTLMTVTRNTALPALLLAQQLYQDGTRSAELIRGADPVHPAFMPTSFQALSS